MTPPVQPQAPGMITGEQLNSRIQHGDPSFPKELWGRTLGDAMKYYGVMREDFMRRNNPASQQQPALQGDQGYQPAQQPAQQPQRPALQGYGQPAPQPQGGQPGAFDAATVQQMIQQAVASALASSPMSVQVAENTHERMRSAFPDWDQFDAEIVQELQGATPDQLSNPDVWRTTYFYVKGRKLSTAPQGQPAPQQSGFSGQQQPVNNPAPQQPAWFTEGPSAPSPAAGGSPQSLLQDPRVLLMAQRFGVSPEEYIRWMNGNVPSMQQAGGTNGR